MIDRATLVGYKDNVTKPRIRARWAGDELVELREAAAIDERPAAGTLDATTRAQLAEALEGSWEDIEQRLRDALRVLHPDSWVWLQGTWPDRVVYEHQPKLEGAKTRIFQRTWSEDDAGQITFGDATEVQITQTVAPVQTSEAGPAGPTSADGSGAQDRPTAPSSLPSVDSGAAASTEAGSQLELGEYVPLLERAVADSGEIDLKIITPGWGNSGYYSRDLLERDGQKVFTAGTKMYWDHPSQTEARDRPERSLRDLAATLTSNARYLEEGADGPGLYAKAKVFGQYAEALPELAPHIGVSIRAFGKGKIGEAEGRKGRIIETIVPGGHSVDFVTSPGAGGKVLELFESLRPTADQEETMSQQTGGIEEVRTQLTEAQTQISAITGERDGWRARAERAETAVLIGEARTILREQLARTRLPEAVRTRLLERLSENPPIVASEAADKPATLDRDKLIETVKAAAEDEIKYLTEAAGLGRVRGMGSLDEQPDGGEALDEAKISEALQGELERMGLSEAAAKEAIAGRR